MLPLPQQLLDRRVGSGRQRPPLFLVQYGPLGLMPDRQQGGGALTTFHGLNSSARDGAPPRATPAGGDGPAGTQSFPKHPDDHPTKGTTMIPTEHASKAPH